MKKPFDRVLIVMFENQYRSYVMRDPFMQKLAAAGADMTNFFGVFHPSQTNYVASLAGEVCTVSNDTPPVAPLCQETLVDLMEPAGITWKAYMEAYPGDPWQSIWQNPSYPASHQPLNEFPSTTAQLARYYRKHNAFASFHTIQASQERWQRIVSDTEFWKDVAGQTLPAYSWFTPDIWNDGHYLYNTHVDTNPRTQLVPQVSGWLEYVFFGDIKADHVQGGSTTGVQNLGLNLDVDLLLTDPVTAWGQSRVPAGTLIVILFDEADFDAVGYDTSYEGPNQIYTVLLGDMIAPGTVVDTPYNHYSLIKTIEKNFGLGTLHKNDRDANWFRFLWDEAFAWSAPGDTGLSAGAEIALATLDGASYLVFDGGSGALMMSVFDGHDWSPPASTGLTAGGPLALAADGDALHLVFANDEGALYSAAFSPSDGWSASQPMGHHTTGSIAMTTYHDDADALHKLMLCWRAERGFIRYLIREAGTWQGAAGEVGQLTDGPMSVAQMGPSLYLVYKERNTLKMRMTSFNVAPFNAFDALAFNGNPAPQNNTSLHQWAPADLYVGHFAKKMAALQNNYQTLGKMTMATIEGEMHLVHRGAYEDTPSAFTECFGLTGIFTASHPSTNGYGTLEQAGWTLEQELPAIQLDPTSALAMTSDGHHLLLVWQASGGTRLMFCTGGYRRKA